MINNSIKFLLITCNITLTILMYSSCSTYQTTQFGINDKIISNKIKQINKKINLYNLKKYSEILLILSNELTLQRNLDMRTKFF